MKIYNFLCSYPECNRTNFYTVNLEIFARVLFSRNFADGDISENKTWPRETFANMELMEKKSG